MSLADLWEKSKAEVLTKNVQQIISYAGDGKLTDASVTSDEFRAFLKGISTDLIQRYVDQCLQESFSGSGFALQDIVNQIGNRLGFKVEYGRYRGVSRASKILGLFDQENLCIYDSRVGNALNDLRYHDDKIILCPPGRNRNGDLVSNPYVWATQYQHLIWTLEIKRDYLNTMGNTYRLADVEMALFMIGK